MPAAFRFDRTWTFPVPVDDLWARFTDTAAFSRWWPWLREFDAPELAPGTTARALIRAPLPYALRVEIDVLDVERHARVETAVRGDLAGPARLETRPTGGGSAARLVWALELRNPLLRPLATLARPVLGWAHDQIVAQGVDQFRRRALDELGVETPAPGPGAMPGEPPGGA